MLIQFLKKAGGLEHLKVRQNCYDENFLQELSGAQSIKYLILDEILLQNGHYDISCIFNLENLQTFHLRALSSEIKISTKGFIKFLKVTSDLPKHIYIVSTVRGNLYVEKHLFRPFSLSCNEIKTLNGIRATYRNGQYMFDCTLDELILLVEELATISLSGGKKTIFV